MGWGGGQGNGVWGGVCVCVWGGGGCEREIKIYLILPGTHAG